MRAQASTTAACRILLIRHAVAQGNGRFNGHTDVPLAPAARRQIQILVRRLSPYPVRTVYSSDLQRAHATALAVARKFNTDVTVRPGLREIHFGSWEGLSWRQVVSRFPRLSRLWLSRFPHHPIRGAERFGAFKTRVARELDEIVAANPGGCAVIVTHGGVARLILGRALGIPDRHLFRVAMDPAAVTVIDFSREGAIVQVVNGLT